MTNTFSRIILATLLSLTLFQCKNNSIPDTVKLLPDDPFKNTIVPSQLFEIDSKQDNVVEGENGTVLVFPRGCFLNSSGEIVDEKVNIELSEALSLEDMLISNLTTTSDGKLLETDGMIYFNATANGEQLLINKDNPVHIEIPTSEKKQGMMAYKGIRDEKGNMNWIEPIELDNYINTVDINSLDFLPEGFQMEVDKGMPYKGYKIATQVLTDSLYYQLSVTDGRELLQGIISTNYNEPFYNKNSKVVDGKYTDDSLLVGSSDTLAKDSTSSKSVCGIDPAIIKVIKSEKYQNTLIATKEFEERLKVIFRTCDNSVLEIYIKNLDKNLYELDSMAAIFCDAQKYYECYHAFDAFAQQHLTKVRQADKYAELLKGYYDKELLKVKSDLEEQQENVMKALNEKNEEVQKVADDYKKLLFKREKYRMETYGFNWTETGWVNIDIGVAEKDWGKQPLEIVVDNGNQFDRVYTYVVYISIKSLYRLNTTDNVQFYAGNDQDKEMLMPKKEIAVAVAIGYKYEVPSLAVKEFDTGSGVKFSVSLSPSSLEQVKEAIKPYENLRKEEENKISTDLEFMAKFYKEEERQKELKKESEFLFRLWQYAFPCCPLEVPASKEAT